MDITLTIPDNKKDLIIDTFCAQYNYQENISIVDIDGEPIGTEPNPESKGAFTKRMFIRVLKREMKEYRRSESNETIRQIVRAQRDEIEGIDII